MTRRAYDQLAASKSEHPVRAVLSESVDFTRPVGPDDRRLGSAHPLRFQAGQNVEVVQLAGEVVGRIEAVSRTGPARLQVRFLREESGEPLVLSFVHDAAADRFRLARGEGAGRFRFRGGGAAYLTVHTDDLYTRKALEPPPPELAIKRQAQGTEPPKPVPLVIDRGPRTANVPPPTSDRSIFTGTYRRDDGLLLTVRRRGRRVVGKLKKSGRTVCSVSLRLRRGLWVGRAKWLEGGHVTTWELGVTWNFDLVGRCQWLKVLRGKVIARGWNERIFARVRRRGRGRTRRTK